MISSDETPPILPFSNMPLFDAAAKYFLKWTNYWYNWRSETFKGVKSSERFPEPWNHFWGAATHELSAFIEAENLLPCSQELEQYVKPDNVYMKHALTEVWAALFYTRKFHVFGTSYCYAIVHGNVSVFNCITDEYDIIYLHYIMKRIFIFV
jgi:hypothetical protein